MLKKINNCIYLSIGLSVLFMILSGVCIFRQDLSLNIITGFLSSMFIIVGVLLLIFDYRYKSFFSSVFLYGIFSILLGILLVMYPDSLKVSLPLGVGVWFIVNGVMNAKFTMYLKSESIGYMVLCLIIDVIAIVCGIVLICKPLETVDVLVATLGFVILVYAISNIVDMLVIRKHINGIVKNIKNRFKEII